MLGFDQISEDHVWVVHLPGHFSVVSPLLLVDDALQLLAPVYHDLRPKISNLRFPIKVCLFMRCQVAGLREPLVAVWVVADVRFFTRMSSEVRPEVEIEREAFVAKCTLERFFTGMHQLVAFEFRIVEEALITPINWTDVLPFTMGHKMLTKRRRVLKKLSTSQHVAGVDPRAVVFSYKTKVMAGTHLHSSSLTV